MGVQITMDPKEICINMKNWVDSVQDRDYWRPLVNAAFNLGLHKPCSKLVRLYSPLRVRLYQPTASSCPQTVVKYRLASL